MQLKSVMMQKLVICLKIYIHNEDRIISSIRSYIALTLAALQKCYTLKSKGCNDTMMIHNSVAVNETKLVYYSNFHFELDIVCVL